MMAVAERAIRLIISDVAMAAWQINGLVSTPYGMSRQPEYEIFFKISDAMLHETDDREALQAFLRLCEIEQVAVVCDAGRSINQRESSRLEEKEWITFSNSNNRE